MPNKLIIENRSDLSMEDCLDLAKAVVKQGRISNDDKQYTYLTVFMISDADDNMEEYHVASDLNKNSDKLTIYKRPTKPC